MANIQKLALAVAGVSLFFASCGNNNTGEGNAAKTDTAIVTPAVAPVELVPVTGSPEYTDAQLSIANVTAAAQGTDSVKLSFAFDVKNYELKNQTSDADNKMCNNSDKGQHIHFILDNKPYAALYEPKHEVVLPKGGEHYVLVFLSRSYHESIKSKGASALYHFKIDEKGKLQKMEVPKTPMVFYSRPKGDYIGDKNTQNLLLDFYVWNCSLSDTGYKVKAQLKAEGVDTSFTITTWQPYFLKNVPMGSPSVTLTLWDKDGKQVGDGITREFKLAKEEPIK
ncbi:MAG: hypothetical protein JST82_08430 [Bacteroidetes bacterium]|nr:hypothetical protein [Bacteroidota bacterium]